MYSADSLKQLILLDVRTENNHLLILISIILLSSLIGGLVSWVFRNDPLPEEQNNGKNNNGNEIPKEIKKYSLLNALLVGLAGAVIVPLFLNLGGNGILKDSRTNPANYFAFAGFCVLGAVFARDFLNSMGKTLLKRVDDLDKKIDEKVKDAMLHRDQIRKESSQKIIDSENLIRKEINKVKKYQGTWGISQTKNYEISENLKTENENLSIIDIINDKIEASKTNRILKKAPSNDPQKYQWGGKQVSNNRKIDAKIKKLHKYWYQIEIEVKSLDPEKPLSNPIMLYVHDTFQFRDDRIILEVDEDGIAREELRAYGAFTIGAVCDEGETFLELDLASLPDVDKEFREN